MTALLPCPLCGHEADRHRDWAGAFVRCSHCRARTQSYAKGRRGAHSIHLAVRDWNRRNGAHAPRREDGLSGCVWCGADEALHLIGPSWTDSAVPDDHLYIQCELCRCRTASLPAQHPLSGWLTAVAWGRRATDARGLRNGDVATSGELE